jgi:spore maturation protein CgeB
MTLIQDHGKEWMNRRLIEIVCAEKPDLMFVVPFTDQFNRKTLRYISNNTDTTTLCWFCDDHWRFENYSRYLAPCFNWIVTTDQSALPKYASIGYHNVIKSQWACNHYLYRKLDLPLKYDVTFVGQPIGDRREIIDKLLDAGIKVHTWGNGWENGRISQEEMIKIFNSSRINLNLTNSTAIDLPIPHHIRLRNHVRLFIWRLFNKISLGMWSKLKSRFTPRTSSSLKQQTEDSKKIILVPQIKGRNFEVPGCGGFLLTGWADNLQDYYQPDREIVSFDNTDDLVAKIQYYLEHEDERAAIAQAGYERTLRQHTYAHRFTEIFKQIGLHHNPTEQDKTSLGITIEIA